LAAQFGALTGTVDVASKEKVSTLARGALELLVFVNVEAYPPRQPPSP